MLRPVHAWLLLVVATLFVIAGMTLRHEPQLLVDEHASTNEWVDVPTGD